MKFNVTITDLSAEELQHVLTTLRGGNVNVQSNTSPVLPLNTPAAPSVSSVAATAGNLPPVSAEVTTGVDSEGLPWDARIHSSSKKQNSNGTWSRRKNVDEALWNSVRAELFSRGAGNVNTGTGVSGNIPPAPTNSPAASIPPAPMIPAASAPVNPVAAMPVNPNELPAFLRNQPGATTPPAAPMAPAPTVAAPVAAPMAPAQPVQPAAQTISDLFNKIQQLFSTGAADVNYVNSLTGRLSQVFSVQVNSINDIAARPDMISYAFQLIAADGK